MTTTTTPYQGIELIIRKISAAEAIELTPSLWARLKRLPADDLLPQSKYIEILCYTGRRILVKIEEAGFNPETWKSYTDFLTNAIVAYGTADMKVYLRIVERLLNAVLGFPSGPQPLLREYLNCAVSQSTQRNSELAIYLAKNPSGELPLLERQPDLEYDDIFVACIVAKPVTEAMRLLEKLPSQLTFAHRHSIMHLRLCNPLSIPGCAYVSTGYCCDTCHLRGIRVGFQAMLYDDEQEQQQQQQQQHGSAGSSPSVRSDAQISRKKTYGFDICMACAVTFYAQQRELLFELLRSPHRSYSFGHVAGVVITQVRYHTRRRPIVPPSASSSPPCALSRQHSGTEARLRPPPLTTVLQQVRRISKQPTSSSDSPAKVPPCDFAIHITRSNSSCGSSVSEVSTNEKRNALTATTTAAQSPPSRPPSRRRRSSYSVPTPPLTRCATQDVLCVTLNVSIAPYGARPIAWVLSRAEKFVHMNAVEDVLVKRIGPSSSWRSHVKVESAVTLRRRRARAAAHAANGQFSTGVGASTFADPGSAPWDLSKAAPRLPSPPLFPAVPSESPRELQETLSPVHARDGLAAAVVALAAEEDAAAEDDVCAICLCPFEGEEPVIETKCHHWFHVACIEDYARIAEDVCPLCRAEDALPDMTRSTTLQQNVFKLDLELTEEQGQQPYVDVCVGSVVTRDGNFRNATSLAAAQCVRVYPNQLRAYQEQTPVKASD